MQKSQSLSSLRSVIFCFLISMIWTQTNAADVIKVCATTPDVADLVSFIGGEKVEVYCFAKGAEDPHSVELRGIFFTKARQADMLVLNGLGVSHGWLDPLLARARNSKIDEGGEWHIDLGEGVDVIEEEHDDEEEEEDEEGVHAEGNPHYILDPLEGIRVVGVLLDALVRKQPESKEYFQNRHKEFLSSWADLMFGEKSGGELDLFSLIPLRKLNAIESVIEAHIASQGDDLGGLFKLTQDWKGKPIVGDHDLWAYFARRFGLEVVGYLEDHPGVTPSPGHLTELIKNMKKQNVKILLKSSYFTTGSLRPVIRSTGVKVVPIAHQVKGMQKATTYLSLFDWNINQIAEAFAE